MPAAARRLLDCGVIDLRVGAGFDPLGSADRPDAEGKIMVDSANTHESFARDEEILRSSERAFGLIAAGVFALIGLGPLWRAGEPRWWGVVIAVVLVALGLLLPRALSPFNYLWFRFGLFLHAIV